MEHELTFQKIKDSVELPELLTHFGYSLKKGETMGRGKWHVFEGDDKLVVFKGHGNDWMYFNASDDRDKGSVIDWMKNRVNSGRVAGIEQLPERNVWQSVNDHFRAYLNLPESQRPQLNLPPISPLAPGEKFQSIYTQDCRPLENTAYLEGRGIAKTTWENPQFAGRILNQLHTVQKEGMPAKTFVNTAFPAYHEGKVVGLELKGENFKGQAPESEFSRSLWLSKVPQDKIVGSFLVGESSIDALSYAQMKPSDNTLYGATAGLLTQNKLFEMKRIMEEHKIPTITAAFDNDTAGHHYDTRLLAGFASEQNTMNVVREHKTLLSVEVSTDDTKQIHAMTRLLTEYNSATTAQFVRESGATANATSATLRDELIGSTKLTDNTYQFHVPMSRQALETFNRAALSCLQFDKRIEIVKSVSKDWNQDLKQQQLQAVVKRELDVLPAQVQRSISEPQELMLRTRESYMAEFGKTFEPRVELEKKLDPTEMLTYLQQRQEKDPRYGQPADIEKQVLLEVHEHRNEKLLVSEIRTALEESGIKVDAVGKTNSQQPRVQISEILLTYRTDCANLATVAKLLDALNSNPKIELLEHPADATQRRQQVIDQQQKKQAVPQVEPGDSPAHDQARQLFVQVAGPLARALREAGAGLDAARLQDLSKFVVKQSELRGTDKESFGKILSAVGKLPGQEHKNAAQQLKQAVEVMEKPILMLEQEEKSARQQVRTRGPRI